jgi:hypothetical protein
MDGMQVCRQYSPKEMCVFRYPFRRSGESAFNNQYSLVLRTY